jgi:hypothetical protein
MLPAIVEEIVDLTDFETASRIVAAVGGRNVRFPAHIKRLPPDHWLIKAAGLDGARKIAQQLGGIRIDVPLWTASRGHRMRLWDSIRKSIAEGKGNFQIAAELGVHERTVRRHRLKLKLERRR